MTSSRTVSPLVPVAAFVFALAHIGFEHFNGGVKTHHFLARADLPGFSNWLALIVLPLARAPEWRDKNQQATQRAWLVMFDSGTAGGLAWRRRSIPERHRCRPPVMTVRPEARPSQDSLLAAATWRL